MACAAATLATLATSIMVATRAGAFVAVAAQAGDCYAPASVVATVAATGHLPLASRGGKVARLLMASAALAGGQWAWRTIAELALRLRALSMLAKMFMGMETTAEWAVQHGAALATLARIAVLLRPRFGLMSGELRGNLVTAAPSVTSSTSATSTSSRRSTRCIASCLALLAADSSRLPLLTVEKLPRTLGAMAKAGALADDMIGGVTHGMLVDVDALNILAEAAAAMATLMAAIPKEMDTMAVSVGSLPTSDPISSAVTARRWRASSRARIEFDLAWEPSVNPLARGLLALDLATGRGATAPAARCRSVAAAAAGLGSPLLPCS